VKPARREPDRCRNIDSAIAIKISQCSKLGCVTDAEALMWAQAAVRIAEKDRHIIRCIVKYQEFRRPKSVPFVRHF
jgi:hypothetical protein